MSFVYLIVNYCCFKSLNKLVGMIDIILYWEMFCRYRRYCCLFVFILDGFILNRNLKKRFFFKNVLLYNYV